MANGLFGHRNSLPSAFDHSSTAELQDLAFSAQQALSRVQPDGSMPIDPALQSSPQENDTMEVDSPHRPPHRDAVMSSIEHDDPMEGIEETARSERRGPSVEPLTPGPLVDGIDSQTNGVRLSDMSPDVNHIIDLPPPVTPVAPRSSQLSSSGRKTSQTPRPSNRKSTTPKSTPGGRRRESREPIKAEPRSEQKARAMSSTVAETNEDIASLALALKLQMEEHGLRRRSK